MNKTQLKRLIKEETKKVLNERGNSKQNAMHNARRALETEDVKWLKDALLRLMNEMAGLDPELKFYLPKKEEPQCHDTPFGPLCPDDD
jgi:hypothetical protein